MSNQNRTRFALETKLLGDAHPDSSEVPGGPSSSSPEDFLARGSQKGSPRLGLLRERDERSVARQSRGLRARKRSPGSSPSPSRGGASAASEMDPQEPQLTDISMSEAGDEPSGRSGQHRHHAARSHHRPRKSGGTSASVLPQAWLRISSAGETMLLGDPSEKFRTTRALGLQARDLRVLDPKLSTTYPSAILYREKAILVNIEFVKAIIAMDFVVVVNPSDENVPAFIAELVSALGSAAAQAQGMGEKARSYTALTDVASKLKGTSSGLGIELPFELKALEVCLDTIASHLDKAGGDLESTAYPILDSLSGKVSERRLERVRVLKNRLVRLTNRVTMVRQLLERFLENDEDMHKLSLTALEASRQASMEEAEHAGSNISTATSSTHSANSSDIAEVAEVEMLLEAYFMHLDNTFNRLQTLNEYVGDTEDLVNIKLDSHRNRLMTVNVMLIAFTTALSFVVALTGLFAMNLDNASTDAHEYPLSQVPGAFDAVTISGCAFAVAFFGAFVLWCKWKNLIL